MIKIKKKKIEKNIFQPTYENTKKKKKQNFFKKNHIYSNVTKTKNKAKISIFLLCFKWVEIWCIYDFF
jgi:hypothetical protein